MKIEDKKTKWAVRAFLCMAVISAGIVVFLMTSYLMMAHAHCMAAERSQNWNESLTVAEAGVEEALAHLNSAVTTDNFAANSWAKVGPGIYSKKVIVGDRCAEVTIQTAPAVTNVNPVIVSTVRVPGATAGSASTRTVRVETKSKIDQGCGYAAISWNEL